MADKNNKKELELLRTQAIIELKKLEQQNSAKEVSSKIIGKTAIPWIVLLVIVGVVSSAFLPSESLPVVIGLVSTAVMALITMLASITGCKIKLSDWWRGDITKSKMRIFFDDIGVIECQPIRANRGSIGARYLFVDDQRTKMIAKLFTGKYNNAVIEVTSITNLIKNLWHRFWY